MCVRKPTASLEFKQSDWLAISDYDYWLAISDYDVIFTALGGEYKGEQNRCHEPGVLPKFHSKAFLKIHKYPSADDFDGF